MGDKIYVGPMAKGLKTNPLAFYIDNDSFPQLINSYPWRGRVKRRRGDEELGRLNIFVEMTDGSGDLTVSIYPPPTQGLSNFQVVGAQTDVFTDTGATTPVATMISTNIAASATLNLTTGLLDITGSQPNSPVYYYPGLPVMGLPSFNSSGVQYPINLAFDTEFAYSINSSNPYTITDASFYLNPPSGTVNSITYTTKTTPTGLWWNGQNYQQFWATNYSNALWVTNGIKSATDLSAISMQFASGAVNAANKITTTTWVSGTEMTFVITPAAGFRCPIIVGDWLFFNEFTSTTPANAATLNFQTGFVTASTGPSSFPGTTTITVRFPYAAIANDTYTPGIIQYLTNNVFTTKDCLRWYGSSNTSPITGFVNFAPPIFSAQPNFGIDDLPLAQYYLVGAVAIFPFKDRLMFFGPVVQSSFFGPFYLQDCVVFGSAGTPYYTASFTNTPTILSATTVFHPILSTEPWPFPQLQSAYAPAYFEDVDGFGGYIAKGVDQPITTVAPNEDALIVGFTNQQTRFLYTGNDLLPFNFFTINSELGALSRA